MGKDIDGTLVQSLPFFMIPWPVINMTPTDPSQIRPEHVREFIMHPLRDKGRKAKEELRRWHPDKFPRVVLSKVREEDKPAVSEAVGMIIRVLTEIRN